MAPSKPYPDDLRDRLIAEAYERLRNDSVEKVSLRDLAASVGTSTNAIYSIFGGKDALVAAVIRAAVANFVERQQVHVDAGPSVEAVRAAGLTYRDWAREQPRLYRLVFGGGTERGAGTVYSDAVLQPLRTLFSTLMDSGLVTRTPLEPLCRSVWAATHGFVLLEMDLWPAGSPDAEGLFDRHLKTLALGFLSPEARAKLLEG